MKLLPSCLLLLIIPIFGTFGGPPLQLDPLSGVDPYPEDDNLPKDKPLLQASSVRLPVSIAPIHYNLQIRPIINKPLDDPEQFTAPGLVQIHFKFIGPFADGITLHSSEIVIQHEDVTLTTYTNGMPVSIKDHSNDSTLSTYTINLNTPLIINEEYILTIPFTSLVADRLSGLYRSSYQDENDNQKWLATTQFQKLGAREAFPCFDEPAMRATFNITVGRPNGYHSLSNSPLISSTEIPELPGWYWDRFDKTVHMPTYLIAIIVSDFVSVNAPAELSKYLVKTWGPPGMTTNGTGEYSAQAAAKILSYLEKYFDYTYQFPKLDSVAIPDFAAGAMENWALNTYRTNLMLWFDGESTQFEQWRQSAVIAHEIVHHWFGDLVTCNWWNDLWLNEGFARYMQFIGSNATGSDFGQMDRYVLDVIQLAMDYDVTSASEPVRSNVTDLVVNAPSRIIYEKAAALIRMMQSFLTEETLIKGLRNYLKKHEYSNTVQDDLFTALQEQVLIDGTLTQFTVKEIMDTWTLKTAFPLIRISNVGSNNLVFVSQERFGLPAQRSNGTKADASLWNVPISYATKSKPDFTLTNWQPKLWLDEFTLVSVHTLDSPVEDWVIANPDARYYYRVLYDDHFFGLVKTQLNVNHTVFSLSTRSQIIDDYFKSSAAKYINIANALDLTLYLAKEDENTVWTTLFNNLRPIFNYLQDHPAAVPLNEYFLPRITSVLNRIGWQQQKYDSPVRIFIRTQLLDWACALNSPTCSILASNIVNAWASNPELNPIPADVQPMMFCKTIERADSLISHNFRKLLLDEYSKSNRAERFTLFINSLACESNYTELDILMDMTIDPSSELDIKAHGIALLQRIARNPANRNAILGFMNRNTDGIIQQLGGGAISSVISTIASYTSSPAIVAEAIKYIDLMISQDKLSVAVKRSLEMSKAGFINNADWINWYAKDMQTWFEKNIQL